MEDDSHGQCFNTINADEWNLLEFRNKCRGWIPHVNFQLQVKWEDRAEEQDRCQLQAAAELGCRAWAQETMLARPGTHDEGQGAAEAEVAVAEGEAAAEQQKK